MKYILYRHDSVSDPQVEPFGFITEDAGISPEFNDAFIHETLKEAIYERQEIFNDYGGIIEILIVIE